MLERMQLGLGVLGWGLESGMVVQVEGAGRCSLWRGWLGVKQATEIICGTADLRKLSRHLTGQSAQNMPPDL